MLMMHCASRPPFRSSSILRTTRFFHNLPPSRSLSRSFSSPRPQLPFLSPAQKPPPRGLARLLSIEKTTVKIKTFLKDVAKGTTIVLTFLGLFAATRFGIDNEVWERERPTPPIWSWYSRLYLRRAQSLEHPKIGESINWEVAGEIYKILLARLEDTEGDGAGILPRLGKEEEILVEGIGKTGSDISAKPDQWRRGYHEALMGAARAAEHLDTSVRDTTRGVIFPRETIKGPSNPHPIEVGSGMPEAPREEDCEPAFEQPQVYYMKILTTHGFTTRQRLDAALAYARYLRSKGLNDSAEDMYNWSFDIALDGLAATSSPPVDKSTGILSSDTSKITSNILHAATALGAHYAQTGNLQAALPVFLSVLRAQQNLPPGPATDLAPLPLPTDPLGLFTTLFSAHHYPSTTLTGDEPASATPATICALSGTMLYIGEVLFASGKTPTEDALEPSSTQRAGIDWTRQAIDLAESSLRELVAVKNTANQQSSKPPTAPTQWSQTDASASVDPLQLSVARKRCSECLNAGLENWKSMLEPFMLAAMRNKASSQRSDRSKGTRDVEKRGLWVADGNDQSEQMRTLASPVADRGDQDLEHPSILEAHEQQERSMAISRLLRKHGLIVDM